MINMAIYSSALFNSLLACFKAISKRKQESLVMIIHFQDTSGPANPQTLSHIMYSVKRVSWEGSSWVSLQEISQEFPEARLCFVVLFCSVFTSIRDDFLRSSKFGETEESERQYHRIKDTFTLK